MGNSLTVKYRLSKLFEGYLGVLWLIALPLLILLSSYFGRGITGLFSHVSGDGWCEPSIGGIGNHCFSDIPAGIYATRELNPWNLAINIGPLSYTPTSLYPFVSFGWFTDLFPNSNIGLLISLGVLAFSLLVPAISIIRTWDLNQKWIPLLFLGLASVPVIGNLDRGNSTALLTPFLVWFVYALFKESFNQVALSIVLMSSLKIQFILLGLILLMFRKYLLSLLTGLGTIFVVLASFALWPGNFKIFISDWLRNLTQFGDYLAAGTHYPTNLSARRALWQFQYFVSNSGIPGGKTFAKAFDQPITFSITAGAIVLGIAICAALLLGRKTDKSLAVLLVLPLPMIVPGTSFYYYSITALVLAAMVLRNPKNWLPPWTPGFFKPSTLKLHREGGIDNWSGGLKVLGFFTIFVLGVTLVPVPAIPIGWKSIPDSYPTDLGLFMPYLALFWTVLSLSTSILMIVIFFRITFAENKSKERNLTAEITHN